MREWLYGRNPVYEVLRARRRQPFRLIVAEGAQPKGRLAEILQLGYGQANPGRAGSCVLVWIRSPRNTRG